MVRAPVVRRLWVRLASERLVALAGLVVCAVLLVVFRSGALAAGGCDDMRPGDDAAGRVVMFVAGTLGSLGLIVWGGAWLAAGVSGDEFPAGIGDAVVAGFNLPSHLGDPARAWPRDAALALPGPFVYWLATAVVVAVALVGAVAALRVWQRLQRVGTVDRRRLGVDARARFARPRDLATLVVSGPRRGRFILGRFGRRFVATECRSTAELSRRESVRQRQGDTGAVALVGPSRSGKTVAAVSGILEWEGPAILSSVKTDLLASTLGWRSQVGEVRIYDPLALSGYQGSGWSPLTHATSITGARRAARNLLEAINDDGTDNLGMWKNLAEYLLAGVFWIAATAGRDMATVLDWVLTQDRPRPDTPSELYELLHDLLTGDDPEINAGAQTVLNWLLSTWDQDERPRSSIYVTAQAALNAFADPAISRAAATRSGEISVDWLMAGNNTVYICSPLKDQNRLAPAFGGLVNDLMGQIYEHASAAPTGRLAEPLLVVLDEAGNQRLDQLPEYASTVAGLGVQLVTIWQSIAQIERAYGKGAGIVLTNHLSKLFYSGLSDPDSLDYVSRVVGEEEIEARQLAGHWSALMREQVTDQTNRVPLTQPHCLRQMLPGDALLLHATLPPAHIQARRWYEEPALRVRAELPVPPHLTQAMPGTPDLESARSMTQETRLEEP